MDYRVGIGYDIHRLVEERRLILGGVEIPYIKGLLGHSDGDALLHAICDAILGAAGLGDIGELFPDTDTEYEGASSSLFLEKALALAKDKGLELVNIDTVVIAEEPRLLPFKKKIVSTIAGLTGLGEDCIGLKAKTNEGISEIGEAQAIACYASVLLRRR